MGVFYLLARQLSGAQVASGSAWAQKQQLFACFLLRANAIRAISIVIAFVADSVEVSGAVGEFHRG